MTLVLILLGLRWLPRRIEIYDARRTALRARARRARDLAVALAAGVGAAALTFAVTTRPSTSELAQYFLANAYEQAEGLNVVNVMLVDFRGFDTLGEITVVCIVAITVYALLRRFRPAPESMEETGVHERMEIEAQAVAAVNDPLPTGPMRTPAVLVRLLLPLGGLVSAYLLLRGHNAPGGGFVGGLVSATAVIAQYMVGGTIWVESRLRVHPLVWIGLGLLAAAGAGIVGWWDSLPFLTSQGVRLPPAAAWPRAPLDGAALRPRRVHAGGRRDAPHAGRARAPGIAQSAQDRDASGAGPRRRRAPRPGRGELMELVYALGIGVLAASGVWLLLRPRTFQVLMGFLLLSYATNLFIFGMGRLAQHAPPILESAAAAGGTVDTARYADPVPQALVLTAIVIGFATTALFLVVLLALRGQTGTDHVDGREPDA